MPERPLILTLRMDEKSQAFFNARRQLYFPPERNFLDAHIMLFHHLPDEPFTYDLINKFEHRPFSVPVTGLMNLGAGVAYRLESKELNLIHRDLSKEFQQVLIQQDRQGFRPHITVMNKKTPVDALELLNLLSIDFDPFDITAIGLDLWIYEGGPWTHQATYLFSDNSFSVR